VRVTKKQAAKVPPPSPSAPKPLSADEIALAYGRLFTSADGKTVLDDLFKTYVYRPSFDETNPNNDLTNFREGERAAVLKLQYMVEHAEALMNPPEKEADDA